MEKEQRHLVDQIIEDRLVVVQVDRDKVFLSIVPQNRIWQFSSSELSDHDPPEDKRTRQTKSNSEPPRAPRLDGSDTLLSLSQVHQQSSPCDHHP